MKEGRLREDLYYRLNVVPLFIPPLRERQEDLPFLCEALIRRLNQAYGRNVTSISQDAIELLSAHDWPGNVRELENVLSRAIINMHYSDVEILPRHFAEHLQRPAEKTASRRLRDVMKDAEKQAILNALVVTGGNRQVAAEVLGISIRSLYYKLNRYDIK